MARGLKDTDGDTSIDGVDESAGGNAGKENLLDRRSYLTLAGSAIAAGMAAGTASASEEYEVIELARGERRVFRVESNETFENVIFDQTARGAAAVLVAHGTNWTVRNVGWRGPISGENRAFTCSDQGGNTSVVENLYIGDGVDPNSASHRYDPSLGIWVNPRHSGHLVFRNVYIEGALDNAFYCSAPGYNGRGGTVHIDNCYTKDNEISHYRLGSTGSKVTNCVAVNTGSYRGRGVWAWAPGPVEIRDCHLDAGSGNYAIVAGSGNGGPSDVDCYNVQYNTDFHGGVREGYGSTVTFDDDSGTNTQDFVPDGVPTSPEEAASGTSGGGSGDQPSGPDGVPLRIEGVADYRIEVDGSIAPRPEFERFLEEGETHGEDWADWFVTRWTEWYVDGEITRFELSEHDGEGPNVTVTLDGEEIDPNELGGSPGDGSEGSDESAEDESDRPDGVPLRIEGVANYRIEVDGYIEPYPEFERFLEEGETHGEDWADWFVTRWTEWYVDGEITRFDLTEHDGEGPDVTVTLDGEEIDPSEIGDANGGDESDGSGGEGLENAPLRIEGVADYRIEVDGSIEPYPDFGRYLEEGETHGEDWADWFVTRWTVWYVTGDITTFELSDHDGDGPDVTVTLADEVVDPDSLGVNR